MNKEDTENKEGIVIPSGIVGMAIAAILCVIIDLIGMLVEYCQGDNVHLIRILVRILAILGWTSVEWYLIDAWWTYRKRKKATRKKGEKDEK